MNRLPPLGASVAEAVDSISWIVTGEGSPVRESNLSCTPALVAIATVPRITREPTVTVPFPTRVNFERQESERLVTRDPLPQHYLPQIHPDQRWRNNNLATILGVWRNGGGVEAWITGNEQFIAAMVRRGDEPFIAASLEGMGTWKLSRSSIKRGASGSPVA